MNNFEDILILESLAIKRSAKLNNIALDMLMNGLPKKPAKSSYLGSIQHDNICTDIEIQGHFRDKSWYQDVKALDNEIPF